MTFDVFRFQRAIRDADLAPTAKSLGWALSTYADKKTGDAYPSAARLARDTGRDTRTVQRAMPLLVDAGFVVIARPGGGAAPHLYHLRVPTPGITPGGEAAPLQDTHGTVPPPPPAPVRSTPGATPDEQPKTPPTKQLSRTRPAAADDESSEEEAGAVESLVQVGISPPSAAKSLVAEHGPQAVRLAVERAKSAARRNPPGYVCKILPDVASKLRAEREQAEREAERRAERERDDRREHDRRSVTDRSRAATRFNRLHPVWTTLAAERASGDDAERFARIFDPTTIAETGDIERAATLAENAWNTDAVRLWARLDERERDAAIQHAIPEGLAKSALCSGFVARKRKNAANGDARTIGSLMRHHEVIVAARQRRARRERVRALRAKRKARERASTPAAGGEGAAAATIPPSAPNAARAAHGDLRGRPSPSRVASRTDGGPSRTRASGVA